VDVPLDELPLLVGQVRRISSLHADRAWPTPAFEYTL
jgi:hypothetical protein